MGEILAPVQVVGLSDVGRVRHHNEDRALDALPVLAVADGMGGAKAGEVAAQMAVDALGALAEDVSVDAVRAAVEQANDDIHRLAHSDSEKAGMGTTVTAALTDGSAIGIVHVGDSRAYLWRAGALQQITDDHSVVAELVRRGSLSPSEAEVHPHRNVITRALGAERGVSPDVVTAPLQPGDVLLLCTDGLSTYVNDAGIAEALAAIGDLDAVARDLVDRANRAGGADNVTVVLARFEAVDGARASAVGAAVPVDGSAPGSGSTAPMRVLGGVHGHAGNERAGDRAASRPPRVLEPVGRRRRWRGPAIAVVVALMGIVGGALWWADSRTYSLGAGADGNVQVTNGLPVTLPGLDLPRDWQPIGVASEAVAAGRPEALSRTLRGQGEAVEVAVELIWRFGLPEPPAIVVPLVPQAPEGDASPASPRPGEAPAQTTLEPPDQPPPDAAP